MRAVNETLRACRDMPRREVPAGTEILRQGERRGVLFVLMEGAVEAAQEVGDGGAVGRAAPAIGGALAVQRPLAAPQG